MCSVIDSCWFEAVVNDCRHHCSVIIVITLFNPLFYIRHTRQLLITIDTILYCFISDELHSYMLQPLGSNLQAINPYRMVLHFYQQQESSTTKTVHKVINKGLKTYV